VMNPPWHAEEAHVRAAFKLLKPGGRLVAAVSAGVAFRERDEAFREWIEEWGYLGEVLPSGSFEGTAASGVIIVLEKAGAAEEGAAGAPDAVVVIDDAKLIKAIEKAYSADSIAEKGTIRQPVFLGGSFWTNVGGSDKGPGPRAQLWRLEPIDTYKGLTYTRQEQEDERRLHKREPGDCTGLVVKWKRDEYVLCDPRAYRWGAPEGL